MMDNTLKELGNDNYNTNNFRGNYNSNNPNNNFNNGSKSNRIGLGSMSNLGFINNLSGVFSDAINRYQEFNKFYF
jgi:hypothetical protein